MKNNFNINEIEYWQRNLGLLPVPLFHTKKESQQFVMLNGGMGNFCLDLSSETGKERSDAWSSNVDHYLRLNNDKVSVYRWDKFSPEHYSFQSVSSRIHEFYGYLKKDTAESNLNIISFSLNIFRQLRLLLRDEAGVNSIEAFLVLLACQAENNKAIKEIEIDRWSLSKQSVKIASSIRKGDWEALLSSFSSGHHNLTLLPNTNLVLRHAAGSLFQEANFEAAYPLEYQMSFEGLLGGTRKASKGKTPSSSHYTPTSIVRTIVEEILNRYTVFPKKLKVFDPACGSGEFLRETIRQLTIKGYKGKLEIIGWDISSIATNMAKFILAFEKSQTNINIDLEIITQDALSDDAKWKTDYDIILMNPPFVSWELLTRDNKAIVEKTLGKVFDKKPNYASAFLWKALNSVSAEGFLGLILPSSIFDADSHLGLRKEIGDRVSTILLGKLGSLSLFSNALVDASIFVCTKKKTQEVPINLWCDYNIDSSSNALRELRILRSSKTIQPVSNPNFSLFKNSRLGKNDNWTPVSYQSWKVYESVKGLKTVSDLFSVMQGVRTGMNSVFLVDKTYYSKLPKEEKKFFRPAVTNETLFKGRLTDEVYLFYPYGDLPEISNEKDLIKHVNTFYLDRLKPNAVALKNRARRKADNWWKLSEHRAWQVKKQPRLVSKEFGESGSLAFDKKGSFVVERGHCWIPIDQELFLQNEDIGFGYITVFSMPIINDLLNALSKQIGGGQWYLASKYVNKMPIPDLFSSKFDKKLLVELSDIGRLLSRGIEVDQAQINDLTQSTFKIM